MRLKNVSQSFGNLQVLKDTSLSVNKNEIVCLLGPSGSGKTTLFNIASKIISPDKGKVELKNDFRKSFVFQDSRLLPWKTVEKNIDFVQRNFLPSFRAEKIRDKLLELTGLKDFVNSYPAQLSGGMKQRIEIIKALSIIPDFILMDEPFKSIDAQTRVNFQQMLLRFQEEKNISFFIITHDPETAVLMADRIYVLSQKPAKIIKTINLNTPQAQRTLKDEKIYKSIQEILKLFRDIVDEFRWDKSKETSNILFEL